jgi:hypothetical protein
MKTYRQLFEGYKKAMRMQAAANRNALKYIGKPVKETERLLQRRDVLNTNITKEKQKMLFRATRASMNRNRSTRDTRAMNIARGIDNVVKLGHEGELQSMIKASPTSEKYIRDTVFTPMKLKIKSGSPAYFGPGPENITDKLEKLHGAVMAGYEAKSRPGKYFKKLVTKLKDEVPSILRKNPKFRHTIPAQSMPGNISVQNISDMVRRIERSRVAGAAARIGVKPGPAMNPISVKELMEQERDAKGQMHFDFEGAREERIRREQKAAEEDRQFDKETIYGKRPKGDIQGIRRLLKRLGRKK